MGAEIKPELVSAGLVAIFWLAQRGEGDIDLQAELRQVALDFGVTGRNQLLAMSIRFQRLTQSEQVLTPKITDQRSRYGFSRSPDPSIPHSAQHRGIALALENGFDYRGSGEPGDVADDMVQRQVHLVQRLLHALYMSACDLHQAFAMAQN